MVSERAQGCILSILDEWGNINATYDSKFKPCAQVRTVEHYKVYPRGVHFLNPSLDFGGGTLLF